MTSAQDRLEIRRRYRSGKAKRRATVRPREPIADRPQDRPDVDTLAFRAVREDLAENCYRLGHLPTADEQFAGRDPRD